MIIVEVVYFLKIWYFDS